MKFTKLKYACRQRWNSTCNHPGRSHLSMPGHTGILPKGLRRCTKKYCPIVRMDTAAHDVPRGEIRACGRCGQVDYLTDKSGLCKYCKEWVTSKQKEMRDGRD